MSTEHKQSYLFELRLYIGLKDPFLKFPAINHLLPKSVGGSRLITGWKIKY